MSEITEHQRMHDDGECACDGTKYIQPSASSYPQKKNETCTCELYDDYFGHEEKCAMKGNAYKATEHTPTPWKMSGSMNGSSIEIYAIKDDFDNGGVGPNNPIAVIRTKQVGMVEAENPSEQFRNAEFIVRAVNEYDELKAIAENNYRLYSEERRRNKTLLEAAKRALNCLDDQVEGQHTTKDALRRSIALAEGKAERVCPKCNEDGTCDNDVVIPGSEPLVRRVDKGE